MLKYFKILLIAAVLGNLYGCKNFLEFEPENFILEEDALKTSADLQLFLNSIYDVARSDNFLGGAAHQLSELMADNMAGSHLTGDWAAYYNRNTGIFNSSTRSIWQEGYFTIGRANKLLETFDAIPDLSPEDRARMEAEAKFLRGMAHFYLVRYFGQPYGFTPDNSHLGIPLRLDYTIGTNPRNTVGEVYTQILADLTDAMNALPETNGGYATSWAAKGMLAKVYFEMNDFQNAFDMANDVITNGPFSLDPDIRGRFAQSGSTEGVFELISTGTADFSGRGLQSTYRTDGGSEPGMRVSPDFYLLATADTSDLRGKRWYTIADLGQPTQRYFTTKYDTLPYFTMPVIHLTELTLLRGEAAAELGNTSVAEDDLNAIRTRAGLQDILGADANTLITLIRDERRLELFAEGNRLFDLKRQAVNGNTSLQIRGADWDCPGMVVQFPDTEIKGNPDFILNDEGGC